MPRNRLLTTMQAGRAVIGFSHVVQDESVTETLRHAAVDFIFIDMQHIVITLETLQRVLIALQPSEVSVLVRPPSNDAVVIGQVLDAGADGVIVPMVNTADDARRAVAAAKYPPEGMRSWGPRRARLAYASPDEYARYANDSVAVFTQVETRQAVENLDAILAVPQLSGVMIGPADLAISYGHMHDRQNVEVQRTFQAVLDRCLERHVPFGFFAATIEEGADWLERGALVVTCSSDVGFVAQGVSHLSAELAKASGRAAERSSGASA